MWPWGHLAVAYLCYYLVTRYSDTLSATPTALLAVLFGSQFPDIVDKPLAWTFGILPSGRSFAHSLLTAAVVLGVCYWLAGRVDRSARSNGTAALDRRNVVRSFGLGWVVHSLTDLGPDMIIGLLSGDPSQLKWATFLIWPLLPPPPYESDGSFLEHFLAFDLSAYVVAQFLLLGVAFVLWATSDGRSATWVRGQLIPRLRLGGR